MIRPRAVSRFVRFVDIFPARTPTLPPATHTNSYAIGGSAVVLIEPATPYADEQRAWIEWGRAIERQGRKLVAVLVTHDHADHVGGVDVLSRELNLPLWMHKETAARIPGTQTQNARPLSDGDRFTLDGPEPQEWRVLHTPGHARGHICLWNEADRIAIVGDMVASVGTILIQPADGDMKEYLEQLDRLASLAPNIALPAHGDPIEEPEKLFRHYIAHRLMRENKILDALKSVGKKGASIDAILPHAYADTPIYTWPIALLSLQSHLDKLAREHRVLLQDGTYSLPE